MTSSDYGQLQSQPIAVFDAWVFVTKSKVNCVTLYEDPGVWVVNKGTGSMGDWRERTTSAHGGDQARTDQSHATPPDFSVIPRQLCPLLPWSFPPLLLPFSLNRGSKSSSFRLIIISNYKKTVQQYVTFSFRTLQIISSIFNCPKHTRQTTKTSSSQRTARSRTRHTDSNCRRTLPHIDSGKVVLASCSQHSSGSRMPPVPSWRKHRLRR